MSEYSNTRRERLIHRLNYVSMERAEKEHLLSLYKKDKTLDEHNRKKNIKLLKEDIADYDHDIKKIKHKIKEYDQKNKRLSEWRRAHGEVHNPSDKGFKKWREMGREISWHERNLRNT